MSRSAVIAACISSASALASSKANDSELYVYGGITTVVQKIQSSAPETVVGRFGSALSADLFLEKGVFDGKALLYINHSQGYDPLPSSNSDYEGSTGGALGEPAYDEGFSDTRIAEAFYEAPLTHVLTVTVGMFSPQRYFDNNNIASDQTRQFLGHPFINNSAIEFPGHRSIHAYPGGVRLSAPLGKSITLQGALFEDAQDYSGTFGHTFAIAEADLAFGTGNAATNLRLTTWKSNINKTSGIALSADRNLGEDYSVFARYGVKTLPAVSPDPTMDDFASSVKTALSAGGQAIIGGDFTVALGYCVETPNDKTLAKSTWIDTYVSYAVNDSVRLAVDYQSIKNKTFGHPINALVDSATVVSGRLQVDF
ncbi:MAG: hypothetical protein HY273_17085 [Gammaproteobacteria bacterium]|nr:hypothetical protein [Gammaproteobacteria bacterium]